MGACRYHDTSATKKWSRISKQSSSPLGRRLVQVALSNLFIMSPARPNGDVQRHQFHKLRVDPGPGWHLPNRHFSTLRRRGRPRPRPMRMPGRRAANWGLRWSKAPKAMQCVTPPVGAPTQRGPYRAPRVVPPTALPHLHILGNEDLGDQYRHFPRQAQLVQQALHPAHFHAVPLPVLHLHAPLRV